MRDDTGPGRPRGFDEDAVLDVITDLFRTRGYEAVSLADIMAATGLRKGSLYAAYGDKRAMYLKALARYEGHGVLRTAATLVAGDDPATALRDFLDVAMTPPAAEGEGRGCFLCNASADQAAADPAVAAIIRQGFDRLHRAIDTALASLDPTPAAPERAIWAAQILSTYAGLRMLARAGIDRSVMAAARDAALAGPGA
ncbi:MAG: TetR/AcrR family transcriptional regulator [Pseudomonadota bacterium]